MTIDQMSSFTFKEILSFLPDCDQFPIAHALPRGVSYVTGEVPGFIEPNLALVEGEEPQNSQVLVVSAAGAVGKSTLAKALASRRGSLFWDLAAAEEVAGGSLDGMLLNTLGHDWTGEYQQYVSAGLQFLVVDALDEGRIKVNESSFRRMLENVAKLAKDAEGVCFVLLGRTRIAEESWLVLSEEGVKASVLAIQPFDRLQANEYINRKLSEEKRTPLFNECREMIFSQLAASVSDGPGSDVPTEFLHYPPVLDVITTLLVQERNPLRLKNYLEQQSTSALGSPVDLLANVIEHILDRDQEEKVIPHLKPLLASSADIEQAVDWDLLYTRSEQCKRLLASVLSVPGVDQLTHLPEQLRSIYEEQVSSFLPEHPFLQGVDKFANSVFQSYLFALALSGTLGDNLQVRVATELLKPDLLPTRLLGEFYLKSIHDINDAQMTIFPEHLGILYDSLASSESSRNHIRLNLDGNNPMDPHDGIPLGSAEGDFEFWTISHGEARLIEERPFSMVINPQSVIRFTRNLRDAFITAPCAVELGSGSNEFLIGPSVQVTADSIRISSENLIVGGNTHLKPNEEGADEVILEAIKLDPSTSCSRITEYPNTQLTVSWPDVQYPWIRFANQNQTEYLGDDETLHRAYMRFKRIATAFRSHSKGALARTAQKIRHQRVLQNELGRKVLAQLETDRILTLGDGGSRYFWNPDQADQLLGVSWQDLRKGECPSTLHAYLSKIVSA